VYIFNNFAVLQRGMGSVLFKHLCNFTTINLKTALYIIGCKPAGRKEEWLETYKRQEKVTNDR